MLNSEEMRAADDHAIHHLGISSLTLMENAARCVAESVLRTNASRILVVCGKGNNGGDGLAAARLLEEAGREATVLLIGQATALKSDPAENWKRATAAGVRCFEDPKATTLKDLLSSFDLVIDALFGTGLTRPLSGVYSAAVQQINQSGKQILSIDVPSGLSSDTGALLGPAIRAHTTVALAALKHCHVLAPASKMCGEIRVVDIGIPASSATTIVRSRDLLRLLPHRSVDSHKGSYGHAVVIGGSPGKSGAPYLSGKSALRCGAGLVTVISPSAMQPVIAAYGPELMTLPADDSAEVIAFISGKTAVAIGPGMGTSNQSKQWFDAVVSEFRGPLLIDADGLNLLASELAIVKKRTKCSTVLTPHPGEMGRLLQTETQAVQKDRISAARNLAQDTQAIVVLKGYRTIVAHPDGKTWIVPTGGHPLASAGTGDVLTGIILGYLSQGLVPLEGSIAAVYLHGLTANLFEARYPQQSMNAMDIHQYWNDAVNLIRSGMDVESGYLKIHFAF